MTHAHTRFGFEAKNFPQTILIKRKVCWHIFVFQSKTFVQTFWLQRKTSPQQSFLVCCNTFVQTVWIKSKIFSRKYFCFKARLSFRPFGFQARLLLKLYSKEFRLNILVSLQDLSTVYHLCCFWTKVFRINQHVFTIILRQRYNVWNENV